MSLFSYLPHGVFESELQTFYNKQYGSLQSSMNSNNHNDNNISNINNNNNDSSRFGLVICPQLLYLLRINKFINVIATGSRGNLYVLAHETIRGMIEKHFNKPDLIKHIGRLFRIFENGAIKQSCFHELFLHFAGYQFRCSYVASGG